MAKPKEVLNCLLHLLNKKPLAKGQIHRALQVNRKTAYQNRKEAIKKGWIEEDNLGRFRLTLEGKLVINKANPTIDFASFEVSSQVLSAPEIMKGRPTAKCTIYTDKATKIMELDKDTHEYRTALMIGGGYDLSENATNIKASSAAIVDAILDLKAKDMGLFSTLKSEYLYAINYLNYETMPRGYDFVKRFKELASAKFNVVIEFDGDKWVRGQNFNILENDHQKIYKDANTSLERLRSLEYKSKIDHIIHKWLDPGWDKDKELEEMFIFESEKAVNDNVSMLFKRLGIEENKAKEILRYGYKSGFFQIKKQNAYYLNINKANEASFFKSLSLQGNYGWGEEEPNVQTNGSGKPKYDPRYTDHDDFVFWVSNELADFERAFFYLFEMAIHKYEEAKVIDLRFYKYPSINGKVPLHTKSAEKLLLELLQIFNEIVSAYMLRCVILWPEKIKDKRVLDKLNSIVFEKIMGMRRILQQSLRSIHGEQFNAYFIRSALKHVHATKNLYKHQRTFRNLGLGKESKSLIYLMWNIHQEIMP